MAQGILFDQTALLEVECDDEYYSVHYGFHTFQEFRKDDLASLRITVTQLVRMGVKKTKLAKYFKVHRKSIEKWEKLFQQEGMVGLANLEVGKSKKCDETVVGYIVELAVKLERADGYKDIIIDEVRRLFDIEISREIIRKVLKEHDSSCENDNEKDLRREREETGSGKGDERIEVKNGGVLLALPLLESNNISSLIPDGAEKERGYSFKEILMTISMLLTGGLLKNEEQVKENDSPCMGLILGINQLPVVRTVRRIVPRLLEKLNINELKQEFAAMFLRLYATRMIFYIDGHFMPYHGLEKILYGYNSLRRIPMKGRTSYVVNLENGRPIYQVLSDNFDNFMENIVKLITFLRRLCVGKSILLVFDREGYGEDFFNCIHKETLFVCWGKGKASSGRGAWKKVCRYIESNIYDVKEKEYFDVKEEMIEMGSGDDGYILRRFFIRKGEKVSVAVSNDLERPIDELVRILTRRWGAQENVFKELKKIGYDNIHSYWKDEYSIKGLLEDGIDVEKEMVNPEYKMAIEERKKLKSKLGKVKSKIGEYYLKGNATISSTKKSIRLKEEIEGIEKEIANANERIKYLPEKIKRFDYVKANQIFQLGNEKKEFFDLLKFISYNVRRDIAEKVGDIYKDNRDIHTIIVKWLKSKCVIQKLNGQMIVTLPCPRKKNEAKALTAYCEYLNSLNYRHFNTGEIMQFNLSQSM